MERKTNPTASIVVGALVVFLVIWLHYHSYLMTLFHSLVVILLFFLVIGGLAFGYVAFLYAYNVALLKTSQVSQGIDTNTNTNTAYTGATHRLAHLLPKQSIGEMDRHALALELARLTNPGRDGAPVPVFTQTDIAKLFRGNKVDRLQEAAAILDAVKEEEQDDRLMAVVREGARRNGR